MMQTWAANFKHTHNVRLIPRLEMCVQVMCKIPRKTGPVKTADIAVTVSPWRTSSVTDAFNYDGPRVKGMYAIFNYTCAEAKNESIVSSCANDQFFRRVAPNAPSRGGATVTIEGAQFGGVNMCQSGRVGHTACEASVWLSGTSSHSSTC
jgi:hypothetical protein